MTQEPVPVIFQVSLQVEIQRVHGLTSLSNGRPANPLRRFRTAIVAIAVLVSRVAEPMCGRNTQLARVLLAEVINPPLFRVLTVVHEAGGDLD
jgi:hypothetical protein